MSVQMVVGMTTTCHWWPHRQHRWWGVIIIDAGGGVVLVGVIVSHLPLPLPSSSLSHRPHCPCSRWVILTILVVLSSLSSRWLLVMVGLNDLLAVVVLSTIMMLWLGWSPWYCHCHQHGCCGWLLSVVIDGCKVLTFVQSMGLRKKMELL